MIIILFHEIINLLTKSNWELQESAGAGFERDSWVWEQDLGEHGSKVRACSLYNVVLNLNKNQTMRAGFDSPCGFVNIDITKIQKGYKESIRNTLIIVLNHILHNWLFFLFSSMYPNYHPQSSSLFLLLLDPGVFCMHKILTHKTLIFVFQGASGMRKTWVFALNFPDSFFMGHFLTF